MGNVYRKPTLASVIGYLILLVVLPVGSVVGQALSGGWGGIFQSIGNPIALSAIQVTLLTSLVASIVNTVAGTVVAFAISRWRIPGHTFLNALVDLPFAIPTTVSGIMLVILYAPNSPIGGWFNTHGIQLMFSQVAIVLAMVFVTFPFVVRAVQPLLEEIDSRMEEAAQTLGATPSQTIRKIILPSVLPGILSGFTLTFNRCLAEFGAVVIVSGNLPMHTQTAPVYLFGLLQNDDQHGAAVISVLLLFISLLIAVGQWIAFQRSARPTIWRRLSERVFHRPERRSLDETADSAV